MKPTDRMKPHERRLLQNAERTATEYLLAVGLAAYDLAPMTTAEKVEAVAEHVATGTVTPKRRDR